MCELATFFKIMIKAHFILIMLKKEHTSCMDDSNAFVRQTAMKQEGFCIN